MNTIFCVRPRGLNIGNDAIFLGVRDLLHRAFDGRVNVVQIPARSTDQHGAPGGLTAATVHEINQYGDGVVVGGGNLYENNGLDVDLQALSALRPPLLLFSLSHGRIHDRHHALVPRSDAMPTAVVRALHERACASVVRDDATLDYLRGLGLTNPVLGGCPTILLGRVDLPAPQAPAVASGTLLSIRHPSLMCVPARDQSRLYSAMAGLVAALEADGFGPVRVLCHDRRDVPFATSMDPLEFLFPDDVYAYLSLLRHARLVVTFRLHAFVPSLAFGTPAINISYDERSSSLVRTLGLESWNVDFGREPDVVAAVRRRCADLARLDALRAANQARWGVLERTMAGAMRDFAHRVAAYAGSEAPRPWRVAAVR